EISEARSSRRVFAREVAKIRENPGLIENCPRRDSIAESFRYDPRIVGEITRHVTIRPTAFFLETLGQIPVIKSRQRTDLRFQQRIHEAAVIVQPFGVRNTRAGSLNPWPADGEAIAV